MMPVTPYRAGLLAVAVALMCGANIGFANDVAPAIGGYYDGVVGMQCSAQDGGCCDDACDCSDCDSGCCGNSCCGCGSGCWLNGLLKPTDCCYSDFISPMTNPVFFEDPRNLTEARFIFLNHWLPDAVGGGDVQLIAMQIRASLTDRLSLVAAKDGFIIAEAGAPLDDGWADVALGLKYLLYADPCEGTLVSVGASYELPVGSTRALQGNGDGEFHLYLTGGKRIGCNSHWLSATGFRLPVDTADETQVWYWSNHADTHLGGGFYAVAELNWYHWMKSGNQAAFNGLVGTDLFNLGGTGVAGKDIVTGALGVKYAPTCLYEVGVAYETHLTDERGVLEDRLTVDMILRY